MRIATFLLSCALAAYAGGGPQNVLVLVNSTSPDSEDVGRYYVEKRRIPARNLVRLRCPTDHTVDLATYQATIERPVRRALRERGIADQIDFIVLCQGMPLRVHVGGEAGGVLALCAQMHLMDTPLAGEPQEQLPSNANPYRGREAFRHADEHGGWHLYLVTHLAAYNAADAKRMIDSSVESEGTAPKGDFVFQNAEGNASGRNGEYEGAITALRVKGFRAEQAQSGTDIVVDRKDLMGYMSGGCYSQLSREKIRTNTYRPGSIVDMLESFGAVPQNFDPSASPSQFPVTFFLDLGVAGIHGAVAEPYAHTFPSAKLFERYTDGYNLAETFYGALPFVHWMNLVDGDPLCAPYAVRPEVTVTAPVGAASGKVALHVQATPRSEGARVGRVELFVDGLRVASAESAEADLEWDTTKFANGPHELLVAATEASPVATQGHAFLTATVDNPTLRVVATVPPDGATNVPLAGPFEVRLNRPVAKAEGIALGDESGTAVPATFEVSEDGLTVLVSPSAPLAGGRRFKGSIAAGWKPSQGDPLPEAVSWGFTTTAKTFTLEAPPEVQAGETFDLKITPRAEGGEGMASYPGVVNLASTDPAAQVLKIGVPFGAQETATAACTLKTLGRTTITALDPESGARGEIAVEVVPGPVKRLSIALPPGGAVRGTPVPLVVSAMDGAGNLVPTFTGAVSLSSEWNAVPLPPSHEYAAFERGRHTFSRVVFPNAGEFSITATGPNGATGTVKVQVIDSGIRTWLWAGPHGPSKGTPAIDPDPIGGETKLAPTPGLTTKGRRWTPLLSAGDAIDLTGLVSREPGIVYAVVYVESPFKQEVELWFGSENVARVFWNGALVHKVDKKRTHTAFEDHVARVKIAEGWNRLTVKLLSEGVGVRFSARLCEYDGKAIGNLTYGLAPPEAAARATIAGTVRVKGQAVPNVPVALTGPEKLSATTGPDGRFEFPGLEKGVFTIKPALPKVAFDPESLKIDLGEEDVLDATFELSDAVPPSVKLLTPKSSAKMAGMVTIAAEATDNVGVRSVRFLVDGEAIVPPIARAPYQASIDANTLPAGAHQIVVEVEDLSGNRVATKPSPFAVVVDKTPPIAHITHPKSGQSVKEKIDIAARVGDDVMVASVQFYVDDTAVGAALTAAPWSVPWTPDRGKKGKHVVKVVVKDTTGNAGEDTVTIEVR